MSKNKNIFVLILLAAILLASVVFTNIYLKLNNVQTDEDGFVIVTSCNPMYMAVMNITDGVEGVEVTNLSQPTTGCLHDYTLTTRDMKVLSTADVLVINGAGMEGFLNNVYEAYPDLTIIDSSQGVASSDLIEDNSHLWMSPVCYMQQCAYISQELGGLDASDADVFSANSDDYIDQINYEVVKDIEESQQYLQDKNALLLQEAFEYLARDLGISVVGLMDLDEERQVSAGEVSQMTDLMLENKVSLIIADPDYGAEMGQLLKDELVKAGIQKPHVAYVDTMVRGEYTKDDYISIMKSNIAAIVEGGLPQQAEE